MKHFLVFAGVTLATLLVGCTSEQFYASGQNWQRNECAKRADGLARERCTKDASTSYDSYRQQAERVNSPGQ